MRRKNLLGFTMAAVLTFSLIGCGVKSQDKTIAVKDANQQSTEAQTGSDNQNNATGQTSVNGGSEAGKSGNGTSSQKLTASEIVKKFIDKNCDNYSFDCNCDTHVKVTMDDESEEMPVTIKMSGKMAGKKVYLHMVRNLTYEDQVDDNDITMYYDGSDCYYKMSSYGDAFFKISGDYMLDELGIDSMLGADFNKIKFDKATLTEDGGNYVIKTKVADLYDSVDDMSGMFNMTGLSELGLDSDEVENGLSDMSVEYVFDKDFNLIKGTTEIKDISMDFNDKVGDVAVVFKINMSMKIAFEFGNYGTIKESDVERPSDVTVYDIGSTIAY